MKNKSLAAWVTFVGGPLGLHRFYLFGMGDWIGWLLPLPTALGLYGLERVQAYGLEDAWSWLLIPFLGFTVSGCALNAIVYGLMDAQRWNTRFNPSIDTENAAGRTGWHTIGAIVASLLVGTTVLMSSIVFSCQHYFEFQIEESKKISQ